MLLAVFVCLRSYDLSFFGVWKHLLRSLLFLASFLGIWNCRESTEGRTSTCLAAAGVCMCVCEYVCVCVCVYVSCGGLVVVLWRSDGWLVWVCLCGYGGGGGCGRGCSLYVCLICMCVSRWTGCRTCIAPRSSTSHTTGAGTFVYM